VKNVIEFRRRSSCTTLGINLQCQANQKVTQNKDARKMGKMSQAALRLPREKKKVIIAQEMIAVCPYS
jgi:hypothetical protein